MRPWLLVPHPLGLLGQQRAAVGALQQHCETLRTSRLPSRRCAHISKVLMWGLISACRGFLEPNKRIDTGERLLGPSNGPKARKGASAAAKKAARSVAAAKKTATKKVFVPDRPGLMLVAWSDCRMPQSEAILSIQGAVADDAEGGEDVEGEDDEGDKVGHEIDAMHM